MSAKIVPASDAVPKPPPPRPLHGAQPVGDAVLDAAALCVQRRGFDNTSLEEVAAEAGVSRTTLYRRFGNRENLFKALLRGRSKPFRAWSRSILFGPGSVEARLETVVSHAIIEIQRVGWLDRSIGAGISAANSRLIKASHAEGAGDTLRPLIDTLLIDTPGPCGVTTDEVLEWIAEQMITLASAPLWEEEALRVRLRYFVMPVLVPGCRAADPVATRLAAIEAKLDALAPQA